MQYFLFLLMTASVSQAALSNNNDEFSLLHFNIKELTTEKLLDQNDVQVNAAIDIIRKNLSDLISINEIQFDLENVPSLGLPGYKKDQHNMTRLIGRVGAFKSPWFYSFEPANTGRYAKNINPQGEFLKSHSSKTPIYADHESFGIFPAQYSTGLASRYPIVERVILRKLKWKDWNPSILLSTYRLGNNKKISNDIPLFDKNFVDSVIKINGKKVHIITLHTVPAYGFGHPKSANEIRNHDQLTFLDWYLKGKCEPKSKSKVRRCKTPLRPLSKNAYFIAIGDWNTDLYSNDVGARVLQAMDASYDIKLLKPTSNFLGDKKSNAMTFLKSGHDVGALKLRLDYAAVSNNIHVLSSEIVSPDAQFSEFGCELSKKLADNLIPKQQLPDFLYEVVLRRSESNNNKEYCAIRVAKDFMASRKASDHFPLRFKFKLR